MNVDREASEPKGADYFAHESYDEDYELLWNAPKDYCLITKSLSAKQNDINSTIYYQVYSSAVDSIVYSDKLIYGRIRWNDRYNVRIMKTIGRVNPKKIPVANFLLDVRNGKIAAIKTK